MNVSRIKGSCFAARDVGLLLLTVMCLQLSGPVHAQDSSEATASTVDYYLPLAEAGNVEAQYLLGLGYERGLAEAVDRRAAARWYRQAADAGHAKAAYRLALLLLRGDSVAEDSSGAYQYFTQAAKSEYPEAYYYLGYMYERGLGVSINEATALHHFEKAAELGLVAAMKAAASLHVRRSGNERDIPKAWYWLNSAASGGDAEALDMKGKLEGMMSPAMLEQARSMPGETQAE